MASALLERETIVQEDIRNIIEAVKSGSKTAKESPPAKDGPAEGEPAESEAAEAGSSS